MREILDTLKFFTRVFQYIEGMRFQVDVARGDFVALNLAKSKDLLRAAVVPGSLRELYASGRRAPLPVPPEGIDYIEDKKVQESEGQAFAIGYPVVHDTRRNLYMPLIVIPVEARDDDAGNVSLSRKPFEIRENATLLSRIMKNPPTLSGYLPSDSERDALAAFLEELDVQAKVGYDAGDPIFSLPTTLDALLEGRAGLEHARGKALLYSFVDADYLFNLRQDYAHILAKPERLSAGTLGNVFSGDRGALSETPPAYGMLEPQELTPSQRRALERIYAQAITPIEGPPGTGKTTLISALAARTIVERALAAAGLSERRPSLLVTSTNNKAVANVLEALRRTDSPAPGYFAAGRRELVDESVESILELMAKIDKEKDAAPRAEELKARLAALQAQIDRAPADWTAHTEMFAAAREYLYWHLAANPGLIAVLRPAFASYQDAAHRGVGRRLAGLIKTAAQWEAFTTLCPVILSTTLSIRNILPDGVCVDTAIVDEASQTLFAYAVPVFTRARRVAVIGDENQLQPIVQIPEADLKELGPHEFGTSALGAIWKGEADEALDGQVLREHFRCRADIIGFSDRICRYGLVVKSRDESLAKQLGLRGPVLDAPLVFVDVSGEHEAQGGSYRNEAEARVAVELLRRVWWSLAPKLATKDLRDMAGVLTPFRAQVSALRKEIGADQELRNFLRRRRDGRRLTVGTVHALQGDEKPIVILSMVISRQGPGTMQFLNRGRNLLNVAVSRAQRTLVVVGERARMEEEEGVWVRELWRYFLEREKAGRALIAKWTDLLSLSNW